MAVEAIFGAALLARLAELAAQQPGGGGGEPPPPVTTGRVEFVLTLDGMPLAGATATLEGYAQRTTDAQGRAVIDAPAGLYNARASAFIGGSTQTQVRPVNVTAGLVYTMSFGFSATLGALVVRVYEQGIPQVGNPVDYAGPVYGTVLTGADGAAYASLPAGAYNVTAYSRTSSQSKAVTVFAGETAALVFNF